CRAAVGRRLGLTAEELAEIGWEFESAGTAALSGGRASRNAIGALGRLAIDLSGHRARSLDDVDVRRFDRIVAMDRSHLIAVLEGNPGLGVDLELLDPEGVPDPIGGGPEVYQECLRRIRAGIERLLAAIGIPEGPPDGGAS
ncbi:MAG: low molecular weight phosphatase family protein, partial [Planctomycetes bacterium]|nr:low molecular weight phosphatase family protein [Planctomycetota bacterium]